MRVAPEANRPGMKLFGTGDLDFYQADVDMGQQPNMSYTVYQAGHGCNEGDLVVP